MKKALLITLSTLAFSSAALADSPTGERWPRWYLGISGGVSFLDDSDISGANNGEIQYDTGGLVNVAIGYRPHFGNLFMDSTRFELEGGYHHNSLDKGRVNGSGVNYSEALSVFSVMGNAYYDFRNASRLTPYLGAGAGWARIELDRDPALANTDESDSTLAWQLLAGLSYAPESIPLTEWSVGYRFFALNDPEFATASGRFELDDAMSHNIEVGAKFRF